MKFQSFSHLVLALMAALLLAACGGGGASRDPNQGGPISVSPEEGTFYAGLPGTITISGGRAPYAITSSDPITMPVPPIVNGHSFEVIPNNPGVVDSGLPEGALPVLTVIVSVRDSTGILVSASIKVAHNFITGYGMFLGASTCTGDSPCAGGETTLIFDTVFGGVRHGNQAFRLERVRGPWKFVNPIGSNTLTDTFNVSSDHEGKLTAVIKVDASVPSQVSIIRIVHVGTGASTEISFTISGEAATASLTLIPDNALFIGATDAQCGTGTVDFLVFDGLAPYTGICPNPNLSITPAAPSTSDTNPGRFTVSALNPSVCLTDEPCVITDATGRRASFLVTTERGPAPTAPPALSVSPTSLTLACGASGAVTVVGGSGIYQASSTHQGVIAIVVGSRVTITRRDPDPPPQPASFPTTAVVSITDGATIANVTVTIVPDDAQGRCQP